MKKIKRKDKTVRADTASGQPAGEAMIEAIENQLRDNDPPMTKATLDRLTSLGESREDALRFIASTLSVEKFASLKHQKPYNKERYLENLKTLPELPFD